jgi:DNA-binding CsgD family transcriptional regulator
MEAAHHITDPEPPWQDILRSAARLVGADSGTLILFDGRNDFLSINAVGLRDDTARDYSSYFCGVDVIAQRAKQTGVGTWVDTNEMMSPSQLDRTEYYSDFMRKHGMAQSLALPLIESPSLRAGLGLQRGTILGDAGDKLQSGQAGEFFRFLQFAFRERQRSFDVHVHTLEETFAGLGDAICLVAANGAVLRASALAQNMLSGEHGLAIRTGRLWHGEARALQHILLAIGSAAKEERTTHVNVAASWGDVLSIDIMPAVSYLRLSNEPALIVRLRQNSAFTAARVAELATVFRLSGAEARVLAALVDGHSPRDFATMTGVSPNTVRKQIRALMRKMQCTRQVELVKLALLVNSKV